MTYRDLIERLQRARSRFDYWWIWASTSWLWFLSTLEPIVHRRTRGIAVGTWNLANFVFWAIMSLFWLFYAWASRPSTELGDE